MLIEAVTKIVLYLSPFVQTGFMQKKNLVFNLVYILISLYLLLPFIITGNIQDIKNLVFTMGFPIYVILVYFSVFFSPIINNLPKIRPKQGTCFLILLSVK